MKNEFRISHLNTNTFYDLMSFMPEGVIYDQHMNDDFTHDVVLHPDCKLILFDGNIEIEYKGESFKIENNEFAQLRYF